MKASILKTFGVRTQATAEAEIARQESLAIAEGLKRQDAGLLDELIVRFQHRLLRYLLFLTGNREQAEDLFQEVWMRVMTRGMQFNGQSRFETWLFTIARNLLIDQRRKRTMSSLDELFEAGGDDDRPVTFEVTDTDLTPFEHFARQEDRERVAAALLEVDALHREVLVLRFHEEMSRLYRGMAMIRPRIERMEARAQEAL